MELAQAHLTVVDIGIVENTNSNKRFELSLYHEQSIGWIFGRSAYTKLGRKWMEMDLTTFDYEIQGNRKTEVALRSRQVAAASGNDLCSQVAALG
jgi:hypothetical protein